MTLVLLDFTKGWGVAPEYSSVGKERYYHIHYENWKGHS
jgi:hypothetical protein